MGKRYKGKRAYLKRFSSDLIRATDKPRSLMLDYNDPEGAYARNPMHPERRSFDRWFDNHGRTRSVVGPANNKELIPNNTWTKPVPNTVGRVHHSYYDDTGTLVHAEPTPKQLVDNKVKQSKETYVIRLQRLWVSQDGRGHGVEDWYPVPGLGKDRPNHKVKLFVNGSKYVWVEQINGVAYVSITYSSRERAIEVWAEDRVTFAHSFKLS